MKNIEKRAGRIGWGSLVAHLLAGCGSGSGLSPEPVPLPLEQRSQAATITAQSNESCAAIQPFYWEIGDGKGFLAGTTAGGNVPDASTTMLIASASKLIFGAYVVQLHNGQLSGDDLKALRMLSGYTSFRYGDCTRLLPALQNAETVHECFTAGSNDAYTAANDGKFFYGGGHFQKHADLGLGLGDRNNASLRDAIAAQLGADISFSYDSPQLAGGAKANAASYALFLRKILNGQLRMRDFLGAEAVCTNPETCSTAVGTPTPSDESWHYSIGHWVEDDPAAGDGAFSSPGAFGFYPWIDASKTYYGILARYDVRLAADAGVGFESVKCGRLIRKAWLSGSSE